MSYHNATDVYSLGQFEFILVYEVGEYQVYVGKWNSQWIGRADYHSEEHLVIVKSADHESFRSSRFSQYAVSGNPEDHQWQEEKRVTVGWFRRKTEIITHTPLTLAEALLKARSFAEKLAGINYEAQKRISEVAEDLKLRQQIVEELSRTSKEEWDETFERLTGKSSQEIRQ